MLTSSSDIYDRQHVMKRLIDISTEHMVVAYRAKMTNYEILLCQEISSIGNFSLLEVLEKMADYKQTSEFLLYKKDFIFI